MQVKKGILFLSFSFYDFFYISVIIECLINPPHLANMSGFDWSLRIPLEHLGADVFPKMFSLEMALKALTPEGNITDETTHACVLIHLPAYSHTCFSKYKMLQG